MIKFIDYISWRNVDTSCFWIKGEGERTAVIVYSDGVPGLDFNPPHIDTIELTPEQVMERLRVRGITPEELIRRIECLSS